MAKPSKKMTALTNDEVARVRRRYADALRKGKTVAEADLWARGTDGEVTSEGGRGQEQSLVSTSPAGPTQTVELTGQAGEEGGEVPPEIPPNWQDLPWPEMKKLADTLAGHDCKSRKQCAEVISGALSKLNL